ncbi:CBD9-like protein [Bimuria novae-zelandiae CBS 107.79]|uniref:CBD9-like protein n=1 Tax=Bimuria novae-zelandiae CBS 107.79 TaxID=1447943 RepID=A0A6A5VBU6_9PLEO|nr:CBD9-like protein [Bimuria novae-zelandiae CBS 107.79]
MFSRWARALVVALFATSVYAQQKKSPPASTFFYDKTETQFSLSLASDSSDVYIHFASPAYSWVGVGFGEGMRDSLMLVMYLNADGDNVTVSPRYGHSHAEPELAPDIKLELLNGTGIQDEMFVLNALCKNCRVWPGGFLDATSTTQPMIFAFGPGTRLQLNHLDAPLRRHVRYGQFTMDLVAATSSEAGVPEPGNQLKGVDLKSIVKDHDRKNLAHAIMGCIALFVFWPINVVFAAFFRNIKIHVGMSFAILLFLVISFALGIATSPQYNRSKSYTSPHQILAFIALLPILLMSLLPIPKIKTLKPWIPRLHTHLANAVFLLLVLAGGLGLRLSSQANPIILAYVAVTLLVAVFSTFIILCVSRRGSAYARATTRRRLGEEDDRDYGLAKWGVRKKLSRSSEGSWEGESVGVGAQKGYGAQHGHERSASAGSDWKGVVGGGTMPGPQYLMNMHPGVPVYVK